jgi:hypothetical protein
VEEKMLMVQEGMEWVLDSHQSWAVTDDCNRSANKSSHPIQNLLLSVIGTPRHMTVLYWTLFIVLSFLQTVFWKFVLFPLSPIQCVGLTTLPPSISRLSK